MPQLPEHFTGPYRTDKYGLKVYCTTVKGGEWTPCLDIRGWGYLTGLGQGALGLAAEAAAAEQLNFAHFVVDSLNAAAGHQSA